MLDCSIDGMEMNSIPFAPRSVEDSFKDFTARRSAIVLALSHDVDEFYSLCDPVLAAYWGSNQLNRKQLFGMINDVPTVYEVVSDAKQGRGGDIGGKSELSSKRSKEGQIKNNSRPAGEASGEDEDQHNGNLCGSCGGNYNATEFWIGCDICERWFRGKCVKVTPAKAESIKQYKCPTCSSKKSRQ